jgi:Xaa-Pro dipeptidase
MTGYASREIIATPAAHQEIRPGQAFAWNPSLVGAKAEETFVLTDTGPEIITRP